MHEIPAFEEEVLNILMNMNLQIQLPRPTKEKELQSRYGHHDIEAIYGCGCISAPDIMVLFINPTARNLSSVPSWNGIRAPWIGVKRVWQMLSDLELIDFAMIPSKWNEWSAQKLYTHVAERKLYITNLATCTQPDARHLSDTIFRQYLPLVYEEIKILRPKKIIALGNQVSSILLQKPISVSFYTGAKAEILSIDNTPYRVYPTYYPVGQGQRNMVKAVRRIRVIQKL